MGAASRLSAPSDCHEPSICRAIRSILMSPLSDVAAYAIPYLVATSVTKSESRPSVVSSTSISVIVDVLTRDRPLNGCPTTRVSVVSSWAMEIT